MTTIDPNTVSLFRDSAHIPAHYWEELAALKPEEVCLRAQVVFGTDQGYRIPFMNRVYGCRPEAKQIQLLSDPEKPVSFQHALVLLVYLLKSLDMPLSVKKINEREIPGGDLFFRGPHALFKEPLEKKFAQDPPGFLQAGVDLGGKPTGKGEASFELRVLPRIPVEYIFYGADEEFPAQLLIHFDGTVYRHLPLDVIWAMVNIIGKTLIRK
jgi:hypothetical protein